jgi:hypothetical protein
VDPNFGIVDDEHTTDNLQILWRCNGDVVYISNDVEFADAIRQPQEDHKRDIDILVVMVQFVYFAI